MKKNKIKPKYSNTWLVWARLMGVFRRWSKAPDCELAVIPFISKRKAAFNSFAAQMLIKQNQVIGSEQLRSNCHKLIDTERATAGNTRKTRRKLGAGHKELIDLYAKMQSINAETFETISTASGKYITIITAFMAGMRKPVTSSELESLFGVHTTVSEIEDNMCFSSIDEEIREQVSLTSERKCV